MDVDPKFGQVNTLGTIAGINCRGGVSATCWVTLAGQEVFLIALDTDGKIRGLGVMLQL